jgi:hypothetical protein
VVFPTCLKTCDDQGGEGLGQLWEALLDMAADIGLRFKAVHDRLSANRDKYDTI